MEHHSDNADRRRKEFYREIETREKRRIKGKRDRKQSLWFGLGMFGMVGWSVAVPTLLCTALGVYLDRRWPGSRSWTLIFLVTGVSLGCLNAWYWVKRESRNE